MSRARTPADRPVQPGESIVLVLSSDAVAAALIGALVETLGYLIRFLSPSESPEAAIRRTRPSVAMVDCADPTLLSSELLGRATMRGVSVVIFGARSAIQRVQELVVLYELDTLIMPASVEVLDAALRRAIRKVC